MYEEAERRRNKATAPSLDELFARLDDLTARLDDTRKECAGDPVAARAPSRRRPAGSRRFVPRTRVAARTDGSGSRPARRVGGIASALAAVLTTLVTVVGVVTFGATAAFANAANPNPGTTGTVVVNSDGSVSISLNGTWSWPGQDCEGRYGEGFAVDWWGVGLNQTPSPNFDLANATEVTGVDTITTGTISEAGALLIPSQAGGGYFHVSQFYSSQDVNSSGTCTDSGSGNDVTSSGPWSAAAIYPSVVDVPADLCVNVYDEHGKEGQPSSKPGSTLGSDFNPLEDHDNSIDTNDFNPTGGSCFSPGTLGITPSVKTVPSASTVTVGAATTDSAVVQGAASITPTGSVAYTVCGPYTAVTACTTSDPTAHSLGSVSSPTSTTADSATFTSPPFSTSAPGTYCYLATYSGATFYKAASDDDPTQECFVASQAPSISLKKSASVSSYSAAGTVVTYSYAVENTGNVTLNPVKVTDPMSGLSSISCPATSLAPAGTETCTATYTTTQADVNAGHLDNTGTATGTPPSGTPVTAQSSVSIPANQGPGISLVKSADHTSYASEGVLITYSYLVTNTGNVTLNPVTVTDPMSGLSSISCPATSLLPAATETCTATYTTTQADVNAGHLNNTGTAKGIPPSGTPVTAQSSVSIPAAQSPAITLVKSASVTSYSAAGTAITYSYKVTNSGNVTLTLVNVTDPMTGLSAISCPSGTLIPAASETCTATYTTTQADVNAGHIDNTGTATGTPPSGPPVTAQSSLAIPAVLSPAITLVKSASVPSYSAPGTKITYSYLVTNTGNVTLNPVSVSDPMPALSAIICPANSLVPTASETCTATYTTTQADVNTGHLNNTGTAVGTPPSGPPVAAQSSVSIPANQNPAISLVKSANVSAYSAPGTVITYSYKVTNTGNVTLNPVKVTDPMPGLSAVSCPQPSLDPTVSETCTATYTATQADVNAGHLDNTGTATGTPPSGTPVTAQASLTIPAVQGPAISLTKSASIASYSAPGAAVTYLYLVTNVGNVELNPVTVTDPMAGLSAITCPDTALAPTASETCTATYTTTQADVDAGALNNTGTATGKPPSGPDVDAVSSVTIPAVQKPGINLVKVASIKSYSAPGVGVTYTYTVTNTGNVTLKPVSVTDPMQGLSGITCPVTSLAPGASEACTATYTTTQADVNAGHLDNTGTATGTPPSGPPVTSQSSVTILAVQTPSITLVKSADHSSYSVPGTVITYSYLVTNTGNVTLNPVTVTDPMAGLSAITCPATSLVPAASESCTATYTTTQAAVDAGKLNNTGTATGTPPSGTPVTAQSSVTIPAIQNPGISLLKSASVASFSSAGTAIKYSYLVTNTGNVTLNPVTVTDPMTGLSSLSCPDSSLAPAASETCTANYTTTQADVNSGHLDNTGTATGTPPSGTPVTSQSSVIIPANQNPAIHILKSASVTSFSTAGTAITYSYLVTNTGNVTLNPVKVTDPMTGLSAISCPDTSLAPAASEICTATYTTTQADVDSGSITNVGTATGTPPSGTPVTDTSTVSVPADQHPGINLVKSASVTSYSAAGTVITYSYKVTNSGDVTLNPVKVTDPMTGLSAITCPDTSLVPGASETCTATYTTTQADVSAGEVSNTGTATGTPPSGTPVTSTSTVVVPGSDLVVTKTSSPSSGTNVEPGDTVSYTLTFSNANGQSSAAVAYTDDLTDVLDDATVSSGPSLATGSGLTVSGVTSGDFMVTGTLAPGATATVTYSVKVDKPDTTGNHVLVNYVIPTGSTPPTSCAAGSLTCTTNPVADIALVKTASVASYSAAGTVITYSYKVTNTGQVTLDPVVVTDPMTGLSAITCPDTTLAPGASETCTASYTTTAADVTAGSVSNTGTATGTPPSGPPITTTSTVVVPGSDLVVTKTSSPSSGTNVEPGDTVGYTLTFTNANGQSAVAVAYTDDMTDVLDDATVAAAPALASGSGLTVSAVSGDQFTVSGTLAAGATATVTYTVTVDKPDTGNHLLVNYVIPTGSTPPTSCAAGSTTCTTNPVADIALVKTASVGSYSAAGTVITYSYKVTNTGQVTLDPVVVTDPMTGLSAITCPDTSLAPGASETCTATYTTTAADVTTGHVDNTGTATGTPPSGPPITSTSSVVIPHIATAPSAPTTTTATAPAKSGGLAFTGAQIVQMTLFGLGVTGLGLGLVLAGRRRKRS